tara:strand:- start:129 stop:1103 length:975 start_codon:yes stop_codon:yes gene_type:complete
MKNSKIPIGITIGDPSGIGPEIVISALSNAKINKNIAPIVYGNYSYLKKTAYVLGYNINIIKNKTTKEALKHYDPESINCIDIGNKSENYGELSYQFITHATKAAINKEISAIVTAPINKKSLNMAGHKYPGHTELIAKLTNSSEVSLMLITNKLKVIHVTTHLGLLDSIKLINPELVYRTCLRGINIIKKLGISSPKTGICAINPHAGEDGLFGYGEEEKKILPAIRKLKKEGFNIDGPMPADALFYKASIRDYDLVVAMYHDQGHCPVKVMGIDHGINITAGLPIIRTSVDHGTAYDIAGKGLSSDKSLLKAISFAYKLIKN